MDEDHPCEGSRGVTAHEQVQWCPAWELWLCAQCRYTRNEAELRKPPGAQGPMTTSEPMLIL